MSGVAGLLTAEIDTTGLELMLRTISEKSKKPLKTATLAESKAILQTVLNRTKVASQKAIRASEGKAFNQYYGGVYSANAKGLIPRISIAPVAGNVWWIDHDTDGKRTFYIMNKNRYWSKERWSEYRAEDSDRKADLKMAIKEGLARRGLPKQSWYLLAELIGHHLNAAGYVQHAKVNGNQLRSVARAFVDDYALGFQIDFKNTSRASYYRKGGDILGRVLKGRLAYFRRNLKKGVFDSMADIAKRYPHLMTVQ